MLVKKALLALVIVLGLTSCTKIERFARGKANEVVIVYDGALREAKFLQSVLSDTFYTPHPEPLFITYPVTYDQFEPFKGYKNVIFLSTYNSPDYPIFKQIFGERQPGIYLVKNYYQEGDAILGVISSDETALWSFVYEKKDYILGEMLKRYRAILRKKAYFAGHNKKFSREFGEKYGFTFDFPMGWAYVVQDTNFVSIAKHYPDRFMFFYHENAPRLFDADEIIRLRNKLTAKYYDGDYVYKEHLRVKDTTFVGQPAIKIFGIWQNDKEYLGGPFETIAFNLNDNFYMFDMGVFAPDRNEKLQFIIRMEIILSSFHLYEPKK